MTPNSTSLNLTRVLPASSPAASWKEIVMTGPCWDRVCHPRNAATSAATIGIAQTNEILRDGTTRGSAMSSSGVSFMIRSLPTGFRRIPHQAGIETFRRQHCQNDHAGEGDGADAGLDRGDVAELDQTDEDRQHEHVDH